MRAIWDRGPVQRARLGVKLRGPRPTAVYECGVAMSPGHAGSLAASGHPVTVDGHPLTWDWLTHAATSLLVTEGIRKADAAVSGGLCCVTLVGARTWRGTNNRAGMTTHLTAPQHDLHPRRAA
jgi:hypothetical protein